MFPCLVYFSLAIPNVLVELLTNHNSYTRDVWLQIRIASLLHIQDNNALITHSILFAKYFLEWTDISLRLSYGKIIVSNVGVDAVGCVPSRFHFLFYLAQQ